MPYLEIPKDNETEETIVKEVVIPDLVGKTVEEAKKELKELGLEIEVQVNEEESSEEDMRKEGEWIITEQLPKAGIKVKEGTSIIVL